MFQWGRDPFRNIGRKKDISQQFVTFGFLYLDPTNENTEAIDSYGAKENGRFLLELLGLIFTIWKYKSYLWIERIFSIVWFEADTRLLN